MIPPSPLMVPVRAPVLPHQVAVRAPLLPHPDQLWYLLHGVATFLPGLVCLRPCTAHCKSFSFDHDVAGRSNLRGHVTMPCQLVNTTLATHCAPCRVAVGFFCVHPPGTGAKLIIACAYGAAILVLSPLGVRSNRICGLKQFRSACEDGLCCWIVLLRPCGAQPCCCCKDYMTRGHRGAIPFQANPNKIVSQELLTGVGLFQGHGAHEQFGHGADVSLEASCSS